MGKTKKQKLIANEKLKKKKVSVIKIRALKNLVNLIEKNNTILFSSSENIPSAQLQKIRQEMKKKGTLTLVKKNIMIKALEKAKKEGIADMKKFVGANLIVIFSNEDAFDLASLISEYKYPARAKVGQISDKDIEIEAGPTDLMPGPAISELSAVGLKVGVEGGKIAIKVSHKLVKQGDKIRKEVAEILTKLDITPFTIGLKVTAVYDSNSKKIFENVNINKEESLNELIRELICARELAIYIDYPTSETIGRILGNAALEESAISQLLGEEK